jgi:hypothetical protein
MVVVLSLAGGSDYSFGSKVLAEDLDIGRPLFAFPSQMSVVFWDIATPGYDEGDVVYLHIGPSAGAMTSANDIRLTALDGIYPAGSKVNFDDIDMNKPVNLLPSIISFLDLFGSRAYDLDDPVYLHHFDDGCADHDYHGEMEISADMLDGFYERLPYHGNEIIMPRLGYAVFSDGYKLFISDKLIDRRPRRVGEYRGLSIEMVHGLRADYYHVLGTWLVKIKVSKIGPFGSTVGDDSPEITSDAEGLPCVADECPRAASPQFIMTNDVRLNSSVDGGCGTKVRDFDEDQNKLITGPPLAVFLGSGTDIANMGYFDANGNGIYDYPDDVYLNCPAAVAAGIVVVNNVRLNGPL